MRRTQNAKVVLLGDSGVGKSSIILRYISDEFNHIEQATIGTIFHSKLLQKFSVQLNIWDTGGQERFNSLAHMYYRQADAVVLVYDITQRQSFQNLKKWKAQLDEKGPKNTILIVAGNKQDLVQNQTILLQQAKEFVQSINAIYIRTSAKTNLGVTTIFQTIASLITPKINPKETFTVKCKEKPKKKCC